MRYARIAASCLTVAVAGFAGGALAEDTVKIGIVTPMTGTSAAVGREISDATKLYVAQHGDTVAGKKIELIIKDDQACPTTPSGSPRNWSSTTK